MKINDFLGVLTGICIFLQGFLALSCPFDVEHLADHFSSRGMSRTLFASIMSAAGDEAGLAAMNPIRHLHEAPTSLVAGLPPVICLHGTADATVPHLESLKLQQVLRVRRHCFCFQT